MTSRILLTTLAMLAGAPAMASTLDDSAPPSVRVRFGDLNLSQPAGVRALRARIDSAARIVCGDYQSLDLQRTSVFRNCVAHARDAALAQIELPAP